MKLIFIILDDKCLIFLEFNFFSWKVAVVGDGDNFAEIILLKKMLTSKCFVKFYSFVVPNILKATSKRKQFP